MAEEATETSAGTEENQQADAQPSARDTQQSGLEKARDAIAAAEGERDAALAELEKLKRKLAAVSNGIPANRTDDYLALANTRMTDGVTFEQALSKALADFPLIPKQTPPPYTAAAGSAPLMGVGVRGSLGLNKNRITK